jgi:hypothetical protein
MAFAVLAWPREIANIRIRESFAVGELENANPGDADQLV